MRKVATKLARAFSGLKVRYKLMILHNLFFLVLAVTAWFSLIPLLEQEAARSLERELNLAREAGRPAGEIRDYYQAFTRKAEITLFLVLGGIYALGVLLLELFVMPVYIYRPLRQLLEADEASRRGDTERELISEELIQGDELGQLMASRNATLRKLRQHEQDLQNALAQLEQVANDLRRKNYLLETAKRNIADQDRLASLGLLSASVAHELNTPLAVLRGSIEKLLETVEDAAAQERLERMLRVTQRLQKLSEGLLDFARVRKQEMEPVALAPLLEEAWSLVAIDEKAASVRFTNETSENDWVRGNSDRLMQLFVNLLRNALYAVPNGGRIRVSSRREADFVTVSVEDNGPGIPPGVLPEIFEAFVTTRLDARGTGLGLTVAEGIAHQHGGSIVAANRPEGGACLEVRLPAAQPERRGGEIGAQARG